MFKITKIAASFFMVLFVSYYTKSCFRTIYNLFDGSCENSAV